jgi:hypothetical protein
VTEALTQLFDDIATHWGAYLAALVALSALTMSLLQVIKDLLFLRLYFQRYQTVRWLYDLSHSQARELLAKDTDRPLENELLRLTSAGHASALYDADLEDFCVQLSAATNFLRRSRRICCGRSRGVRTQAISISSPMPTIRTIPAAPAPNIGSGCSTRATGSAR